MDGPAFAIGAARVRLLAVQDQLQHAHDRLEELATTDPLTGLPNHGAIVDVIDRELVRSRRHARPFALLFLDLDHFKQLNDRFGHLAGDEALRGLARLLRACLREIDSVGRWGGEEFVVVLPESDAPDAVATAERIRSAVTQHGLDGEGLGLTCSIGVASYPEDAVDRSKLLELADGAMYAAKARGRNCTVAAGDARAEDPGALAARGGLHSNAKLEEAESRAHYLADHDILTGLYNRGRLIEELDRHLRSAARYGRPGALLLIDIDNFRLVNDSHGHTEGDRLLKVVAELVGTRLGTTDVAARLQGDEFAVILPEASEHDAILFANQLRGALHDQLRGPGFQSSVGVNVFGPSEELSPGDVMVGADIALYEAKERGGGRTEVYHGQSSAIVTWADRIWTALGDERFILYGQPIVELNTGAIVRQELLIRMVAEDGDIVAPDAFLPTADRFGVVKAIDGWVTAEAIRLAQEGMAVSLNLSGPSIGDQQILDLVREAIDGGVDPAKLVFEVTETAAMTNLDATRRFGSSLSVLGCALSLDDFGTGFGSFTYLKHLPSRYLKIDMEFIHDLAGSKTDQQVVRAICAFAQSLGRQTIAEGVEDADTVAALRTYGVDFAQGYHIGRPKRLSPATGIERRLRTGSLRRAQRRIRGSQSRRDLIERRGESAA